MLCCVVLQKLADVSGLLTAAIIRCNYMAQRLRRQSSLYSLTHCRENLKSHLVCSKFAALCYRRFSVGICCNNCEVILATLNLSTLYSRWWHLHALFLINVLKNKISCSSISDSVCADTPTRIIRDNSTFMVNYNFKVSPSARCVSAANATCMDTEIFYRDYISLMYIL
jgi:hypothetical protein